MKKTVLFLSLVLTTLALSAQDKSITGHIYNLDEDGVKTPLAFANIVWLETQTGTVSEESGFFELNNPDNKYNQLVVSFIGYQKDTISVTNWDEEIEIVLISVINLEEVKVEGKQVARSISSLTPINTETITSDGLQRLACCSLAESFETTATIDVGYSDAVSGAKKIKMLGVGPGYISLAFLQKSIKDLITPQRKSSKKIPIFSSIFQDSENRYIVLQLLLNYFKAIESALNKSNFINIEDVINSKNNKCPYAMKKYIFIESVLF